MTPPILGIWASQISGHLWAPTGAYDALATVTVPSGGAATIDFAGIPTGYKHLEIRYIARDTRATSGGNTVYLRFNNDSGSNYSTHDIEASGASVAASSEVSGNRVNFGVCTSANDTANVFGAGIMVLTDYTSTTKNKTLRWLNGFDTNGAGLLREISGGYYSLSAVTSLTIYATSGNFAQYSSFALYGIK